MMDLNEIHETDHPSRGELSGQTEQSNQTVIEKTEPTLAERIRHLSIVGACLQICFFIMVVISTAYLSVYMRGEDVYPEANEYERENLIKLADLFIAVACLGGVHLLFTIVLLYAACIDRVGIMTSWLYSLFLSLVIGFVIFIMTTAWFGTLKLTGQMTMSIVFHLVAFVFQIACGNAVGTQRNYILR